jgi:hypothetical protein
MKHEQTNLKWGNQAPQYLAYTIGGPTPYGIWQGIMNKLMGESSPTVRDRY